MKKYLILVFSLLIITNNSFAHFQEIHEYIQDHKKALTELEPHIASISVEARINKSYQQIPFAYYLFKFYEYLCPAHIYPLLSKYQVSREELQNIAYIQCAKKGLIAGIIAACGLKIMKYYPSKTMYYLAALLVCAGIIAHQNHTLETVPYYDWELRKQQSLFSYDNQHTWYRFMLAFNATMLSCDISQWGLSKMVGM